MKTAALASVLTLFALGGCNPAPAPDSAPGNTATTASPSPATTPDKDYYADRINALTDKQRDTVLFKAIKDAGGECPSITGSGPHDPVQGHHAWIAHCAADKDLRALDWVVVLGSGGMMSIVRPGAL